ncbi:carboxypeptidase-like regulatory domain-containing protein [Siphonobacter sp. BAB-5385]|uniref:carboxypeptidase-like regulatory domain-containing protein n=1 Tax=Siphonobacter sp. BAB-5385 TaxID=1864822 RepID=UPI0020CBB2BD|nr:carboxypeptidase-like regulatory domain-containing protein [Siphonobacter sp. BAB-5385]
MKKKYLTLFQRAGQGHFKRKLMLPALVITLSAPLAEAALTKKVKLEHGPVATLDRTITGTVTDKDNKEGLPGVSIQVKGTSIGTTTDAQGKFKLTIPEQGILVFSFVGYTTVEQPIGTQTSFSIELASNSKELTEVLVVGYGTQTKKEFTGSAARYPARQLRNCPSRVSIRPWPDGRLA